MEKGSKSTYYFWLFEWLLVCCELAVPSFDEER